MKRITNPGSVISGRTIKRGKGYRAVIVEADDVRLEGCAIEGGVFARGVDGLQVWGCDIRSRGIHLVDCEYPSLMENDIHDIESELGPGIWLVSCQNPGVLENTVLDIAPSTNHPQSEGIRLGRETSGAIVYKNTIGRLRGAGPGITTDVFTRDNVIEENMVFEARWAYSEQYGSTGNIWRGNKSERCTGGYDFMIFWRALHWAWDPKWMDSGMPKGLVLEGNTGTAGLAIGACSGSTFKDNTYPKIDYGEHVLKNWKQMGNTFIQGDTRF